MKPIERLKIFKQRYFAWGKSPETDGRITHLDVCDFYRSKEIYHTNPCTCGLLYDLDRMSASISMSRMPSKLFPPYIQHVSDSNRDQTDQEIWDNMSEDEKTNMIKTNEAILEKMFGPFMADIDYEEEEEAQDIQDWLIIEEVFGKDFRDNSSRIYANIDI